MSPELTDWTISVAALMHFLQVPSMAAVRTTLRDELAQLDPFMRGAVLLFSAGIVICVTGLGTLLLVSHGEVFASVVGRRLCLFFGIFWSLRGVSQWLVFARIWPRRLRWLHHSLALFYPALGFVYSAVFLVGAACEPAVEGCCGSATEAASHAE